MSVINFSDFLKDKNDGKTLPEFNKEEMTNDFFIKEDVAESNSIEKEEIEDTNSTEKTNDDVFEEEVDNIIEEDMEETIEPLKKVENNYYKLFKDKAENFSCEVELEGANLKDTQVRLILETKDWNLVFNGDISSSGKVNVPIKKLNLFEEGTIGKIKMEIIAEGTVFTPWEEEFEVKLSKKVMVKFNESSNVPKKDLNTKPSIKINKPSIR